ncbi:golgin IMH1-like [Rhopalosiphum maidis]|uniref:golgin IMH1-like n=1 Tax=Rhopalosiphum maidis TaxID=43146 RepID=UPI000EFF7C63|nr:golgin IMH1-like [Rhopalosiphum maidis]
MTKRNNNSKTNQKYKQTYSGSQSSIDEDNFDLGYDKNIYNDIYDDANTEKIKKLKTRHRIKHIKSTSDDVKNANDILQSIKTKNINAIIPNLATIITLSKESSDYSTVSEKLTRELISAIEHNVGRFLVLDGYLNNQKDLLKFTESENTIYKLDLFKIENQIRDLWNLIETVNSVDPTVPVDGILDNLKSEFKKIRNLIDDYTVLTNILRETEQKNTELSEKLKNSQEHESKLVIELNTLNDTLHILKNTGNPSYDSEQIKKTRQQFFEQLQDHAFENIKLHGDVLTNRKTADLYKTKNQELENDINKKDFEINLLHKRITRVEHELQTLRDTKTITERMAQSCWSSAQESENKKDRIAWHKNSQEIDILLDDIKQINNIINENSELQVTVSHYLTTREYSLPSIPMSLTISPYSVPAALTYLNDDENEDDYTSYAIMGQDDDSMNKMEEDVLI